MQTLGYKAWLNQRGLAKSSVRTYVTDAKRVERYYGDLDELHSRDHLDGVLQDLWYSADDGRKNKPNTSKILVPNPKSLSSYRSTVRKYREYLEAGKSSDGRDPKTPEEDIAEAAAGQALALDRLRSRPRPAMLSLEDLRKARRAAEEIGRLGEALVDFDLRKRRAAGEIADYVWASDINAIEPYDFRVERAGSREKLEVKSTSGPFGREFHLPLGELREMAHGDAPYRIARIYDASEDGAKMRLSHGLREYGQSIIGAFAALPPGVTPNGVTIVPDETMFGEEAVLAAPAGDED